MPSSSASTMFSLGMLVIAFFSLSVHAFAPRSFLKREDPAMAKGVVAQQQAMDEKAAAEQKRFDLGGDAFYGGGMPQQAKRFEMFDGYYEQPWAFPQHKRFDYLDGFYSGPGPAAAGFYPFYAPAKRFDYGFGPRARPLSGFL